MKRLVNFPEKFDPYDMQLKLQLNPQADAMNFIHISRTYPVLACGATKKGKKCTLAAGFGTSHVGHGRCKYHGGCNTGPKTEEGKSKVGRNPLHGLYRATLRPYQQETFDQLMQQEVGLDYEINFWKLKITEYLQKNRDKWQRAYEAKLAKGELLAEEAADKETRVFYSVVNEDEDGESISRKTHFYHAGTIEDKPLVRALETLSRLIDKHAKLKGLDKSDADNILEQINSELRGASFGQVSISWGGKPQTREEK